MQEIIDHMTDWIDLHPDIYIDECGDVRCTLLAEDYANEVLDADTIPDEVFEAAAKVAITYEEGV